MAEDKNFQQILVVNTIVCCLPPLLTNVIAICVVARNQQVNSAVRSYLVSQHTIRSYKQFMRIAFDTTCTMIEWCLKTDFTLLLNISVGTLSESAQLTLSAFELIVSFNRLFAIILGGLYYKRVSRWPKLQCLVLFALPMALYIPWQIAGLGSVFLPGVNSWALVDANDSYYLFLNIVGNFMRWSWYVTVAVDCTTMFLLRKRFGSQEREVKQEVRLAKQVFVQHLIGVSLQLFVQFSTVLIKPLRNSRIHELVFNWYSQLMYTAYGLNTIYFLREKTEKSRTISVRSN